MLVTWMILNVHHPTTDKCAKGVEPKLSRLAAEEIRVSMKRAFQAYIQPLKLVISFKYLGQILTALDDDWLVVVGNLRNMSKKWMRSLIIMG